MTLWHERMGSAPDPGMLEFTESLSFDRQLAPFDLEGSKAHVAGLVKAGLISTEEGDRLVAALEQVGLELESGTLVPAAGDEDIHTLVERRVTELLGELGGKLHTARSRNDQVATDLRLYAISGLYELATELIATEELLGQLAQDAGNTYMPGYTHLQRAQPVLLAHHLLAHAWALARDFDRAMAAANRAAISPLGAGALAGSSLPVDPDFVAGRLGFGGRFENSLDAVSDRDFLLEVLFCCSTVGIHLSRLAEEVVLWSTEEFGFIRLADAWSTGSSMLPQKKNPDVAELTRAKAGRLIGNLTAALVVMKGLPLSYNRDLQEANEPLFESLRIATSSLVAMRGVLGSAQFDAERMQAAADSSPAAAVDLAEWLVQRGMPFRAAHGLVAGLVREAYERRVDLSELVEAHPALGPEAAELLVPGAAVTRRQSPGGGGPGPVAEQLSRFQARLSADRLRLEALGERTKRRLKREPQVRPGQA